MLGNWLSPMNSNLALRLFSKSGTLPWAVLCVLGGVVAQAMSWQSILSAEGTSTSFVSPGLWRSLVESLGGRVAQNDVGGWVASVDFLPLLLAWSTLAGVSWLLAARLVRRSRQASWSDSLA